MSGTNTIAVREETSAERDRRLAQARSEAARLMASANKGKRRRRPSESLKVGIPVDQRTHAGRAAQALRTALLIQIGPKPSAAQLALVQQVIQLKLRLAMMDQNFLAAGGVQSAHDSALYLAWNGHFTRALRMLGLDAEGDAPITLADALAAGAHAGPTDGAAGRAQAHAAPPQQQGHSGHTGGGDTV